MLLSADSLMILLKKLNIFKIYLLVSFKVTINFKVNKLIIFLNYVVNYVIYDINIK